MKSPPVQHPDDRCRDEVEGFIARYGRGHAQPVGEEAPAPA